MTDEEYYIDYGLLVEKAMCGVVREILEMISEDGLKGNHHFYISFMTNHEKVVMPEHLRRRYSKEMTVVLQHQFWELEAEAEGFTIGLSFDGQFERIYIPYDSLINFVDPSVNFGLQFHVTTELDDDDDDDEQDFIRTADFNNKSQKEIEALLHEEIKALEDMKSLVQDNGKDAKAVPIPIRKRKPNKLKKAIDSKKTNDESEKTNLAKKRKKASKDNKKAKKDFADNVISIENFREKH